MRFAGWRDFLWPVEPEAVEGFRAEVERLGRRGLRIIGGVEIIMPILGSASFFWTVGPPNYFTVAAFILVGILTYWSAATSWGSRFSREIGCLSGLLSVALGMSSQIHLVSQGVTSRVVGSMPLLTVLLVGVAVLPLRPVHALVLGGSSGVVIRLVQDLAISRGWIDRQHIIAEELYSLPLVVLLLVVLTGVSYQRLAGSWQSHQYALQAAEELRRSESRTLIAESAAAMGRLAAAVSHELNSPLGAMKSAAGTLPSTFKLLAAGPEQSEKVLKLAAQLCDTLVESSTRMQEIVNRMQRFTNLDRAEALSVDLNQLLRDVSSLVSAGPGAPLRIETELGDVCAIRCRPQQLSTVFSNLLHFAAGRAGSDGCIRVKSKCNNSGVTIEISDNGPPLAPDEVSKLFDPRFRVSGRRITTGDWSLFAARRMINEAGGDVRVEPAAAGGAAFVVTLPPAA